MRGLRVGAHDDTNVLFSRYGHRVGDLSKYAAMERAWFYLVCLRGFGDVRVAPRSTALWAACALR